jgi:hypothetical protein
VVCACVCRASGVAWPARRDRRVANKHKFTMSTHDPWCIGPARSQAQVQTEGEERRREAAHRRRWSVAAVVVDGRVRKASDLVLHNKGCIKDKPQHKKKDGMRPAQ